MANPLFDELRPASFRGIPFQVEGTSLSAGRRVQLHEYPQRDKPYAQDMGRASRTIRFRAFVIGRDYIAQANKLLAALETNGPGELIHPWFGKLNVNALETATVEFDSGLGVAEFDLSFVESGDLVFPAKAAATQKLAQTAAATLQSKVTGFFSQVFKVAGFVNTVAQKALMVYGNVQSLIANPLNFALRALGMGSLGGNLLSLYSAFTTPLVLGQTHASYLSLAAKSATYLRTDASLSSGVQALVQAARHPMMADPLGIVSTAAPPLPPSTQTGSGSLAKLYLSQATAYSQADPLALSPYGSLPFPDFAETHPALTPSEQQQYVNAAVIYLHTRTTILVQAVGVSSLMPCDTYDVAMATRDMLCAALDREAQSLSTLAGLLALAQAASLSANLQAISAQADSLDALYSALMDARAAVHTDLTTRAANAARLKTVTRPGIQPSLAIAYDLYEDASREDEIILRNHIRRPGFAPETLQVLSA